MRRPAVFFDRDNTLIVGHDYIGDPNRVELMPGAPAAIAKCRQMGFAVVVVSNQSGVARGMFTEVDVRACNRRLDALLLASNGGAVIDRHEYCPFHPEAVISAYKQDSFLRKPKPGMILAAADAMALDLANSWVVGDAPRDITAGKAAGCRTVLIVDPTLTPSPAAMEKQAVEADFIAKNLVEAVDIIAEQVNKPAPPVKAESEPEPEPVIEPKAAPVAKIDPLEIVAAMAIQSKPQRQKEVEPVSISQQSPLRTEYEEPRSAKPTEAPPGGAVDLSRLESISQQMLVEIKKLGEHRHDDFSLSKLGAGIVQILAVAAVPLSYIMYRGDMQVLHAWLLTAIFLQLLTIALLIMGRQR